jgi:hypothetical protein
VELPIAHGLTRFGNNYKMRTCSPPTMNRMRMLSKSTSKRNHLDVRVDNNAMVRFNSVIEFGRDGEVSFMAVRDDAKNVARECRATI